MSETTKKIDLRESQKNSSIMDSLSEKEKSTIISGFEKYRETEKNKEKLGIIYLTQTEISKLRSIIDNPESVSSFIDEQLQETITTWEILSGTEIERNLWWTKNLERFSQISEGVCYKYLFSWENAPFVSSNFSEDAKRNLSVGMNFFLFDMLLKNKELFHLEETIEVITSNLWSILSGDFTQISWLLSLWDTGSKIVESMKTQFWFFWDKMEKLQTELSGIELSNKWESNTVFMNPEMWFVFFSDYFSDQIKDPKQYIINHESTNPIVVEEKELQKLQAIWNQWGAIIPKEVWEKIAGFWDIFQKVSQYKEVITEKLNDFPSLLSILWELENFPLIGWFIKFLGELLGISSFKEMYNDSQFWNIKKGLEEICTQKWFIISGVQTTQSFMKKNKADDTSIVTHLANIWISHTDTQKHLENLLTKWSKFDTFQAKLVKNGLIWNIVTSGKLDYNNLRQAIIIYEKYINDTNDSILIDDFIEKYKAGQSEQETLTKSFILEEREHWPTFENNKLSFWVTIEGDFHEIHWFKDGAIIIKTKSGNNKFSLEGVSAMMMSLSPKEFFTKHAKKITTDDVIGIIKELKENITKQKFTIQHKWESADSTFTLSHIETNNKEESTESTWVKGESSKETPAETFINNTYSYNQWAMEFIYPITFDTVIKVIGDDKKIHRYKINKNYIPDSWSTISQFWLIPTNAWYTLLNPDTQESINVKELYNTLKGGPADFSLSSLTPNWSDFSYTLEKIR